MTRLRWDRWLPVLVAAASFSLCLPRILDYGITWDEPTYLRFARWQADWVADLGAAVFRPAALSEVFASDRIARVWLQHPVHNGHPPLHESWMGIGGRLIGLFGVSDLAAMRASVALLFAAALFLLYRLLRTGLGTLAASCGVLLFAGVPAIWAHAHLGATEIMQCFFWISLALALPWAMRGGRASLIVWGAICALAFSCKFTNVLAIGWALGTMGLLGGWRRRRFWSLAIVGIGSAFLGLLILDPYFWPWQGGAARYLDYLRQCLSRADWIPISVFYMGRNWGFDPPWHYRIVETVTTLPVPALALFLVGSWFGVVSLVRQLRAQTVTDWPRAVGVTGVGIALGLGLVPEAPDHDITRQFVFIYLAVAILAAGAAETIFETIFHGRRAVGVALAGLSIWSLGTALAAEPFGLGYRNELLGGWRGAWDRGFEISYWGEAITPALLQSVDDLRRPDGAPPRILSIPKVNYFSDAQELWKPLVHPETASRARLGLDALPAFYERWITPELRAGRESELRATFREPIDGVLFFWRRGSAAENQEPALTELERRGDLRLVAETRLGGVSVGRLYAVERMTPTTLPADPEGRTWYRLGGEAGEAAQKNTGQLDP